MKIRWKMFLPALCALALAGCQFRLPFVAEPESSSAVTSSAAAAAGSASAATPSAAPAPSALPPGAGTLVSPDAFEPASVPSFEKDPAVEINGGVPFFSEDDLAGAAALCADAPADAAASAPLFHFTELDALERAGTATAILSKSDMATAERVPIPGIKPSGWHNAKYEWIDGNYVYNRCHLLGYQLTAENGDIRNLITGTRYLNIEGMLPYENRAAYYLRRNPSAHILYRVTPVYAGEDLVASGVLMEAISLEDGGEGLCFCVYCYNVQPGVVIDYATGVTQAE